MTLVGRKDTIALLFGDIASFALALWVALLVRYFDFPSVEIFYKHLLVFSPAFFSWVLVFFIFGLYDKQTTSFKRKLPDTIFNVTFINGFIALAIFYLSKDSSITPKTNLVLCLIFSVANIFLWRVYVFDLIRTSRMGKVAMIGKSKELEEIKEEILKNKIYGIEPIFFDSLDLQASLKIKEYKIKNVILETRDNVGKESGFIGDMIFMGVNIMSMEDVYENLFNKVPLSILDDNWFLNITKNKPIFFYDFLKRIEDLLLSIFLGVISIFFYPFVFVAVKIEDGGKMIFSQKRVGKNGSPIKIVKLRTMAEIDSGKWVIKDDPRITKVGSFLRKTRIDEFPQLWNVFLGDLSLIGPRPEIKKFVDIYDKEIPYYNMRHLIKPGLSGWAQIHHEKPPQSVDETKEKLAYDLYYIKNRSIMLDLEIALKTIKTLLSRTGM